MIQAYRVDDRLIHGQVQTQWLAHYRANRVIIVDDQVIKDSIAMQILKLAKPAGVDLVICGTDRALGLFAKDEKQEKARTFVIFKTIKTAVALVEQGLEIKELIVGPSSSRPGAVQMAKNTYFGKEELQALEALTDAGVETAFQLLPGEPKDVYKREGGI